jgi:hypothetical protein
MPHDMDASKKIFVATGIFVFACKMASFSGAKKHPDFPVTL